MIDPIKITNFDLDDCGLEEHILFWVCAAGKNGITASKCLDKLLNSAGFFDPSPFAIIRYLSTNLNLSQQMKACGIGCYNNKAKTFTELVYAELDLKTCSVDKLEKIYGLGPKTVRCFLIHTRPNQRYAGLDTHILKFLKDKGHDVPKSTPTGKKYKELEQIFLMYADQYKMSVAEFDLQIWNYYREKTNDRVKDRAIGFETFAFS
jgi:hypothetical protein